MKNAALILNVVLLLAVGALFYLHFSSDKKATDTVVKSSGKGDTSARDFRIAYFEMDSIQNSLLLVKDVTKELSEKEQTLMNDLARMEKTLYDKANEYQGKANTMSQTESELATNDMAQRRRNFEIQKERAQQDYQNHSIRRTNEIRNQIQDFLTEYNKGKGYSYIISYEPGFIFYRDSMYNVTNDVIKGINALYSKKK